MSHAWDQQSTPPAAAHLLCPTQRIYPVLSAVRGARFRQEAVY